MKKIFKICCGALFGIALLSLPSSSYAAKLYITPPSSIISVGEKVTVDVKIDGEGVGFNGAQATINFPKDILQVSSISKNNSALNFWLEDPNFSNDTGIISFVGGTPYGVSGSSVQILSIVFTAKGIGNAELTFNDTAVTASDGNGTNILSKFVNAFINVSPIVVTPDQAKTTQQIIEPVKQIVRQPVAAKDLPVLPVLDVSLYPNGDQWYNIQSIFNARWNLPLDVSGVSTAINKNPKSLPQTSEGLFDSKAFDFLKDGVWYLHVGFKNNVGWGPVAHRRIAIDTQPPLGFDISVLEGTTTDNPTPTLQFKTSDALSGVKEYEVRADSGELFKVASGDFNGSYKLPAMAPGKHRISVRAIDQAENGIENSVNIDITPISSPEITYVTSELFSGEQKGLAVKGTAIKDSDVLVFLYQGDAIADKGTVRSDSNGNWEFVFGGALKNGIYTVKAQNRDNRGALSLLAVSSQVTVKNRPIIQIGNFQLGSGGAFAVLIMLMAIGFVGGFLFYKKRQGKVNLRVSVAGIDFEKMLKIIREDVKKLEQARKTPNEVDDEFVFGKLEEDMKKMENYLKKEIEKIKN